MYIIFNFNSFETLQKAEASHREKEKKLNELYNSQPLTPKKVIEDVSYHRITTC